MYISEHLTPYSPPRPQGSSDRGLLIIPGSRLKISVLDPGPWKPVDCLKSLKTTKRCDWMKQHLFQASDDISCESAQQK
ncbi:hypothetical protein ATANTOWER_015337 [Ataeniobius toweri]|uniref:Uncharacterized protein n=1 Tax=Ataeniobius toweri TaxID=208326 RepID=A0ABU7BJ50_9TELE|nr:hypothetical protein [Ataeniobius toweri]